MRRLDGITRAEPKHEDSRRGKQTPIDLSLRLSLRPTKPPSRRQWKSNKSSSGCPGRVLFSPRHPCKVNRNICRASPPLRASSGAAAASVLLTYVCWFWSCVMLSVNMGRATPSPAQLHLRDCRAPTRPPTTRPFKAKVKGTTRAMQRGTSRRVVAVIELGASLL